jgi:GNAT superfamily N-acetyltransferase
MINDMDYVIVEKLAERQVEQLWALYQSERWSRGRTLDDVREMLQHTDVVVGFCEAVSGDLIAFARVLTDRVFKALIFDVIVHSSHRKKRLGEALMNTIVGHPSLKAVRHFELYCFPEVVAFYERWGFTDRLDGLRLMRAERGTMKPPTHANAGVRP